MYIMSRNMTKPTKWHVRPAKTQISMVIRPVWSVFAVCMEKAWVLSYPPSTQRRLWSDWADAKADLSLGWVHSHLVGLVMLRLLSKMSQSNNNQLTNTNIFETAWLSWGQQRYKDPTGQQVKTFRSHLQPAHHRSGFQYTPISQCQ